MHRQRFASLVRMPDWIFVKDSVVVGAGSTIAPSSGTIVLDYVGPPPEA